MSSFAISFSADVFFLFYVFYCKLVKAQLQMGK